MAEIRARVKKVEGRWEVSVLRNGKVVAHGAGGWSTWDAAYRCAVSAVAARRSALERRMSVVTRLNEAGV